MKKPELYDTIRVYSVQISTEQPVLALELHNPYI